MLHFWKPIAIQATLVNNSAKNAFLARDRITHSVLYAVCLPVGHTGGSVNQYTALIRSVQINFGFKPHFDLQL